MTYGEWVNEELGWHQTEHILSSLNCGREYHVYVVMFNALGASPASQVLTTRTLGNRPTAPTSSYDFILANTTFLSLKLDQWDDHNCEILYFVIEYKMASADHWITVTNDLQPQARYSLRGLAPDTDYQLKVTAHNHAGSTSMRYNLLLFFLLIGFGILLLVLRVFFLITNDEHLFMKQNSYNKNNRKCTNPISTLAYTFHVQFHSEL